MLKAQSLPRRPVVLVVDDVPQNLTMVHDLLRPHYQVRTVTSGRRAFTLLESGPLPDLVLLDILMPDMDGYAVCRRLKADARTQHIPVIFLTALTDGVDEAMGLGLGAVDYISKPISAATMLARVATHLSLKAAADQLRDRTLLMERELARNGVKGDGLLEAMAWMLAAMGQMRDRDAVAHMERLQACVAVLARALAADPRYSQGYGDDWGPVMSKGALLHDVGMCSVPDRVLLKPEPLNAQDLAMLKKHVGAGLAAIEGIETRLGRPHAALRLVKEMALSHHERWDGSGYPQGLAGEAIPPSARVIALVDAYVAITSRRVFRAPMSHAHAVAQLRAGSRRDFDPGVLDAFLGIESEFEAITRPFCDTEVVAWQRA